MNYVNQARRKSTVNVLWLLQYLLKHRRMTYADARTHLGIHERTYRRYVALLRESGANVFAERGSHSPERGLVRYGGFSEWRV